MVIWFKYTGNEYPIIKTKREIWSWSWNGCISGDVYVNTQVNRSRGVVSCPTRSSSDEIANRYSVAEVAVLTRYMVITGDIALQFRSYLVMARYKWINLYVKPQIHYLYNIWGLRRCFIYMPLVTGGTSSNTIYRRLPEYSYPTPATIHKQVYIPTLWVSMYNPLSSITPVRIPARRVLSLSAPYYIHLKSINISLCWIIYWGYQCQQKRIVS